jgi:hypothetical protein
MTKIESINSVYVDSIKSGADKLKAICEKIIAGEHSHDDDGLMELITKLRIRAQGIASCFDKLTAINAHFGDNA